VTDQNRKAFEAAYKAMCDKADASLTGNADLAKDEFGNYNDFGTYFMLEGWQLAMQSLPVEAISFAISAMETVETIPHTEGQNEVYVGQLRALIEVKP